MLFFHLSFVFLSITLFTARVLLSQFKPETLKAPLWKVAPHVIDTFLLVSGISLLVRGAWLDGDYAWVVSKFVILLAYIGLGAMTMRSCCASKRWLTFSAAIGCYAYIILIAMSKQGFFYFD